MIELLEARAFFAESPVSVPTEDDFSLGVDFVLVGSSFLFRVVFAGVFDVGSLEWRVFVALLVLDVHARRGTLALLEAWGCHALGAVFVR